MKKITLQLIYFSTAFSLLYSCDYASSPEELSNAINNDSVSNSSQTFKLRFEESLLSDEGEEPHSSSSLNFTRGINGRGLCFGRNDILQFNSEGNINAVSGSVSMWMKPNWNPGHGQLYKLLYYGRNPKNMEMHIDEHDLIAIGVNSNDHTTIKVAYGNASYWEAGYWHHLVFTWDEKAVSVYVNGNLEEKVATGNPLPEEKDRIFHIGSLNGHEGFDGVIDELMIFSDAITTSQVSTLYQEFEYFKESIGFDPSSDCGEISEKCDLSAFTYKASLDSSKYYISNEQMTWKEAKTACENAGGHLVVINSKEENDLVTEIISSGYYGINAWLGLTDEKEEGKFEWIDGMDICYKNWNEGEPNNEAYPGCDPEDVYCTENYVHIHGNIHPNPGSWNDAPNDMLYHAIIEIKD